jgi:hypothetical protein
MVHTKTGLDLKVVSKTANNTFIYFTYFCTKQSLSDGVQQPSHQGDHAYSSSLGLGFSDIDVSGCNVLHRDLNLDQLQAGVEVGADIAEPVLVDEDPFAGHTTETDVSEALQ